MNKAERKQLESELLVASQGILKRYNISAASKVEKHLKDASKKVSKKFFKAVGNLEKPKNNAAANGKKNGSKTVKSSAAPTSTRRRGRPKKTAV